jgi:hypothetical protein
MAWLVGRLRRAKRFRRVWHGRPRRDTHFRRVWHRLVWHGRPRRAKPFLRVWPIAVARGRVYPGRCLRVKPIRLPSGPRHERRGAIKRNRRGVSERTRRKRLRRDVCLLGQVIGRRVGRRTRRQRCKGRTAALGMESWRSCDAWCNDVRLHMTRVRVQSTW